MRMNIVLAAVAVTALVACAAPPPAEEVDRVDYLNSGKSLPIGLPFSEAVRVGDTLYLSGQIGNIPGTLELVPGGVEEEARQVMENIKTSLETHGYSMSDLVKCTVMLADIGDWPAFNEIYKKFFTGRYPARSAFGANGLAVGASVEVECFAVRQENEGG